MFKLFKRPKKNKVDYFKLLNVYSEELYANVIRDFIENCSDLAWKKYIQDMIDRKCENKYIVLNINVINKLRRECAQCKQNK